MESKSSLPVQIVGSAALTTTLVVVALVAMGWAPVRLGARASDYLACAAECKGLFAAEEPSQVACVQGCAMVAEPGAAAP